MNVTIPSVEIDHKNGNKLDNRKENLRLATKSTNGMNRPHQINNKTGYKGVSWAKREGKYVARILSNHIGYYDSPEDAARAYDDAALRYFGEFAWFNFPLR